MWFWAIVLIALIGAVAVVAVGRGGSMVDVYDDRSDATIPTGRPLTAEDVRQVRLSTGFRGYRMDEVDALLERVEADLLARETENSRLHESAGHEGADPEDAGPEDEPDTGSTDGETRTDPEPEESAEPDVQNDADDTDSENAPSADDRAATDRHPAP